MPGFSGDNVKQTWSNLKLGLVQLSKFNTKVDIKSAFERYYFEILTFFSSNVYFKWCEAKWSIIVYEPGVHHYHWGRVVVHHNHWSGGGFITTIGVGVDSSLPLGWSGGSSQPFEWGWVHHYNWSGDHHYHWGWVGVLHNHWSGGGGGYC